MSSIMFPLRGFWMNNIQCGRIIGRRALLLIQDRTKISLRQLMMPLVELKENNGKWPRKIFSGIQPTGSLHLGNYLGAVRKWVDLQNSKEDVTFSIVDMHSITLPQEPIALRENTFRMAATLLACGIDPNQSTMFVQSAVSEHNELCWILSCLTTMARLGHLPQFKERTRQVKDVPLGLFVYPVLQAADIMLYKATHVPVGEDQVQHIQLAQHLTKTFNSKFGETFPICHAVIENKEAARIRSLREPTKKMSKSDIDQRATINLMDDPIDIVEKVKKAVTDFCSDVKYVPDARLGVSNLIAIHSMITGKSISQIVDEAKSIDTGKYKMRVADAIIEHIKPIRAKLDNYLCNRNELIYLLDIGAEKARQTAEQTMIEVRRKVGLGAQHIPIIAVKDERKLPEIKEPQSAVLAEKNIQVDRPLVPKQEMRIEKERKNVKIGLKKGGYSIKQEKFQLKFDYLMAVNPGPKKAVLQTPTPLSFRRKIPTVASIGNDNLGPKPICKSNLAPKAPTNHFKQDLIKRLSLSLKKIIVLSSIDIATSERFYKATGIQNGLKRVTGRPLYSAAVLEDELKSDQILATKKVITAVPPITGNKLMLTILAPKNKTIGALISEVEDTDK